MNCAPCCKARGCRMPRIPGARCCPAKGAAQAVMRHIHTNRRLRLQRQDHGRHAAPVDRRRDRDHVPGRGCQGAMRAFMELLDRCRCRCGGAMPTSPSLRQPGVLSPARSAGRRSACGPGREINSAARALAARAQKLGMLQSESQQQVVGGKRRLFDFNEVPLPTGGLIGFRRSTRPRSRTPTRNWRATSRRMTTCCRALAPAS